MIVTYNIKSFKREQRVLKLTYSEIALSKSHDSINPTVKFMLTFCMNFHYETSMMCLNTN